MLTKQFTHFVGRLCWLQFLIVMPLMLAGCGTTGRHFQAYQGTPTNTNEVVLLKVQRNISFNAIVETIDGISLKNGKWWVDNNTREIELLPGKHDLEVAYADSNNSHSISNAPISFVAEPGRAYELHVAPLERSFTKELLTSFPGGHFWWTLWITDAETKKVIAGEPRATPIHWYEK